MRSETTLTLCGCVRETTPCECIRETGFGNFLGNLIGCLCFPLEVFAYVCCAYCLPNSFFSMNNPEQHFVVKEEEEEHVV